MIDRKAVHEWVRKYLACAGGKPQREFLENRAFGETCEALGFAMDGGQAFSRRFSESAFHDVRALAAHIMDVDDAALLGSAIFSKWRYLTRWAMGPADRENDPLVWFTLAFLRLEQLTAEERDRPQLFGRTVKKLILRSEECWFWHLFEDGIKRQRLSFSESGRGTLSEDCVRRYPEKTTRLWTIPFRVRREKAAFLFQVLTLLAQSGLPKPEMRICDGGDWTLRLSDGERHADIYDGEFPIDPGIFPGGLSAMIRRETGLSNAWAFDGHSWESITNLTVEFLPQWKETPAGAPQTAGQRREILELDGAADQLTYEKDGTCLTIRGGVRDLLEACSRDGLFAPPETRCQCAEAPVLLPNMDRDRCDLRYRILVRYRRQPEQVLEGSFDRNGLPETWPAFADRVTAFFQSRTEGALMNPALYRWRPREAGEYIYCSVVFQEGGKRYHYRTEDETLRIGDRVLVPVGPDNEPKPVTIVNIEYFQPADAPFPPSRTKVILGRVK